MFRVANSFKFIGKYGIFRYKSKNTASLNTPNKLYTLSLVLYLDIVFDYTNNTLEDKRYVVFVAMEYFKNSIAIKVLEENEKNFLNSILQKILKCKYISDVSKRRLKANFKLFEKYGIITETK